MKKKTQHNVVMLLLWGIAGLGVGLLIMALLMQWLPLSNVEQARSVNASENTAEPNPAAQNDVALQAALTALREGRLPQASAESSPWTGLWQALQKLHDERTKALATFEDQVRQAAPGPWMQAAQLITPQGRQTLEERLRLLDQALNTWTRRESDIQSAYDDALHAWVQQAPEWLGPDTRQAIVESGSDAARALHEYVRLEQSLLLQIRHLSSHIDSLGPRVKLSASLGTQAELVFVQRADLNRYQSSVERLSELAQQEQAQMSEIRQVDQRHLQRLANALSMMPPTP